MTTTVRPELITRIRLVTRLLAFGDPRASSSMPPFVRARRFLEHLCTLNEAGWTDVITREADDTEVRDRAERLIGDMFMTEATVVSRDAIVAETRRVVRRAADNGFLAVGCIPRAARLSANATLALVLRDALPDAEFRTLYGSFVEVPTGRLG